MHRSSTGGATKLSTQRIQLRYSLAFRQKVVSEIESGRLSIAEARRVYDIKGWGTISGWLKKLGKYHLLNRVVRIEMKDEKDRVRQLEKEKRELESALAQAHLKNLALEALIEIARERYNIDLKKNIGEKESKKS